MNDVKKDTESIDDRTNQNITNDIFDKRIETKNQEQFNAEDNIEIDEPIQELDEDLETEDEDLETEDTIITEEKNNRKAETIFCIFCGVMLCCSICFIIYLYMYNNTNKNYYDNKNDYDNVTENNTEVDKESNDIENNTETNENNSYNNTDNSNSYENNNQTNNNNVIDNDNNNVVTDTDNSGVDSNNDTNTNNNIENNTTNNTNVKSAKDKLIDVLLKYGYKDYAGDRTLYYTKREIMAPNGNGYCIGSDSVHFGAKNFEVKFLCYSNNTLAYDRTETYSWETYTLSSKVYEYNEYNGQLVNYVNVTSDNDLNFSCNINNCDEYKKSLIDQGNYFAGLLSEAGISAFDLD